LAEAVWGTDRSPSGSHTYGRGKVYWGMALDRVFSAEHIAPDVTYEKLQIGQPYDYPLPDTKADEIVWIHRKSVPGDLYFISNQRAQSETVSASFRVIGKVGELWHPGTGTTESASYRTTQGRTVVDLRLAPLESVFVVFRTPGGPAHTAPVAETEELVRLPENWTVTYAPNLGAPPQIQIDKLASWTESNDPGIRYFSGSAIYSQDIDLTSQQLAGEKAMLDLGRVREIAEVSVNGKKIPQILWKPPFVVDVSGAVRAGKNHIEVKVTNLWPNRIIGDQQPGTKEKYTFTVYDAYQADSPPIESGLLGPVSLIKKH
jgi:hypothetical protein